MTTNTYQALCDSVWAYEKRRETKMPFPCILIPKSLLKEKTYPPATAAQRERLEELIFKTLKYPNSLRIYSTCYLYFDNPICIGALPNIINFKFSDIKTRSDALYALTQKLVDEGILCKEEVKEALCL